MTLLFKHSLGYYLNCIVLGFVLFFLHRLKDELVCVGKEGRQDGEPTSVTRALCLCCPLNLVWASDGGNDLQTLRGACF